MANAMRASGRAVAGTVLMGLLAAGCQAAGPNWGTAVVKESDAFDYYETVVTIPVPTGAARAYQCTGPFAPNTSDTNLKGIFGQGNVVQSGDVVRPDGSLGAGSVLLPNDPKLRVAIAWGDAFGYTGAIRANFTEETAWSVNGVMIGSSVADLEKANGKPFRLVGFGGDGGGIVTDWQGGALANLPGGCSVTVQLAISALAPASAQARVVGPRVFLSSDRNVRALKPTVGKFWVLYN